MNLVFHLIFLSFTLLSITSCEVGPTYRPPQTEAPESWKTPQTEVANEEEVANWWEIFHDETLNDLMEQAIQNNPSIYAAIERVIQARAIAGIAKSDMYPQIGLNPNYTNEIYLTEAYASKLTMKKIPRFREHLLAYNLPINLSWEIDLWGRLKNIYKSALYTSQAQYEDFRNLMLLVTTDLASSYFQLRTFDKQIDLYESTIKTRKKALEINQSRYESQLIDYVPVSQATLDLANAEAEYYDSLRERTKAENQIATLLGIPASEFKLDHNPIQDGPPVIPAGVPSQILMQRPDLREAERQRASTHALVKSAYASFLPTLTLTGAVGFSSPDLKHFLSWASRYWNVGGNSFQTIIDGGRRLSTLELDWAKYREADINYQQLVLSAFQEVEDALADIEFFYKELEKLDISVEAASKTYKLVFDRYIQGVEFYLAVVDSERDLLNAQRTDNNVLGARYSATIQLIKALGGSWSQQKFCP